MSSTTQPLFHSLLSKEVYATGHIKQFAVGTVILNMHAYIKSIPIVLKGSIKVMQIDDAGREILLYYITAGESCIMSILAGINNNTSKIKAIVEEDAEVLILPVKEAISWIKEFPEWTEFIFSLYQKRFEELLTVVNAVAFQKLDARLLHLLHQKAALYNSKTISITHQQLADEMGAAREAVSRILKQMEKSKLVSLSRNKISIM